jgi:hypothetical protein
MFFNSYLEKRMISTSFDTFGINEKNALISEIANRHKLMFHEVNNEYILNHHRLLKIEILKEQCEITIEAGFTASNGHAYRTNRDDQINMIGQKDELTIDTSIATVMWKTEDVGYFQHTREEWLKIYNEAFAHKKATLFRYDSLKKLINEATSHDEIIAINWDTQI